MKTINFRYIRLFAAALVCMILSVSCKDFLSEKPYDFYDEADFYKNVTELELAVNGAFEVLSDKMTYGHFMLVTDCDTDVSHVKDRVRDIRHVTWDITTFIRHIRGWKKHGDFIIQV